MKRRRTLDNQGKPLIEVKTRDGYFKPEVDDETVQRLNALDLSIEDTARTKRPDYLPSWKVRVGSNPYEGGSVEGKKLKSRSKLDYMRALSEEIKKRRQQEAGQGGTAAEGGDEPPPGDRER